ncbi:MAG TPA: glycoside hydrolase family 43 protein [Acidimicrobiales bacterium]|nr:glycoside hydrolase family 43 protein [Acidimicrobiales bacterium]
MDERLRARWSLRAGLVILAGALLVAGLVDDLSTQTRLHHADVAVQLARDQVRSLVGQVAVVDAELSAALSADQADTTQLARSTTELTSTEQELQSNEQALTLQDVNLDTVNACVAGLQIAVGDLEAGRQQSAITQLAAVAATCQKLQAGTPGGPVYPFDFPDPDLIDVAGTYYGYATNSAGGNIQIIESTDLSTWTTVGDALPSLPAWATTGTTWAPGVLETAGRFLLFYATGQCISVATASTPTGPFVDSSTGPLVCQAGGSIDPAPYTDGAGQLYLTWKQNAAGGHPATIWAQPMTPSGMAMAPGTAPTAMLVPAQSWERSVVEGPFMWLSGGTYYLFYSGSDWNSGSYAIGVATCQGPLGPCARPLDGPLYASQSGFVGPGGESVFLDAQGRPWIAFHAWQPDAIGYPNPRLLYLRPLAVVGGVPQVQPPA